ncbi:MAG: nucleoside triphosphate pyrophosphohydrolase [Bacillota bacterium]
MRPRGEGREKEREVVHTVYVVGMGPGPAEEVPARNLRLLQGRTPEGMAPVLLRTAHHPLAAWLSRREVAWESCDSLYEEAADFDRLYGEIAARVLERAGEHGTVVYGVPGHPLVGERTVGLLLEEAPSRRVKVRLLGAPSFLEAVFSALGRDPLNDGFEAVDARLPAAWMPRGDKPLLVCQLWHPLLLSDLKLRLLDLYPPDHRVALVSGGGRGEAVSWIPLVDLDRGSHAGPAVSLWVPPLPLPARPASLAQKVVRAVEVVARLRGQGGCPWDREQTHLSLRPYAIEEAYEVAEAIRQGDKLAEELGDLLLQVLLHAQIAREEGDFDLGTVCDLLVDKLLRRHPHVFATASARTPAEVLRRWNEIKKEERGEESSALDGVPVALPALQRAWRVQGRAREVGFDWEAGDVAGVLGKVQEELDEVRAAAGAPHPGGPAPAGGGHVGDVRYGGPDGTVERELGDLLFAVVNACRILGADPEVALQDAVDRFSRRFRAMERMAREAGKNMGEMSLEEMDSLWEAAKRQEE